MKTTFDNFCKSLVPKERIAFRDKVLAECGVALQTFSLWRRGKLKIPVYAQKAIEKYAPVDVVFDFGDNK